MVIATETGTEDTVAVVGMMITGAGKGIMRVMATMIHANNEGTSFEALHGSWWVSRRSSISYSLSSGVSSAFLRPSPYGIISRTRVRICDRHH